MAYRAEDKRGQAGRTVEVEGVLDAAAVDELQDRFQLAQADCLFIRVGTVVTADGIERLRSLPSRVASPSPYLERWLAEGPRRGASAEQDRSASIAQRVELDKSGKA